MNDKVMRMAIECHLINTSNRTGIYADALQKFANLIRADEREACANIDFYELLRDVCSKEQAEEYAELISTAIRAKGNT